MLTLIAWTTREKDSVANDPHSRIAHVDTSQHVPAGVVAAAGASVRMIDIAPVESVARLRASLHPAT